MKAKTKTFLGIRLEQVLVSDLSVGESFYNLSNVEGKIQRFDNEEGVAYIDWKNKKDGSCWNNSKCWRIIQGS